MNRSNDDHFYARLTAFERFDDFVDFDAYAPVPDDWVVMISDVKGSTKAIEQGRYKDVNMVGAASITAILNVCGDIEVPYVFGGDGGTLVVPGGLRDAAATALFVAGPDEWLTIASRMDIHYVMLIDADGVIHMNPAMQSRIRFEPEINAEIRLSEPLT